MRSGFGYVCSQCGHCGIRGSHDTHCGGCHMSFEVIEQLEQADKLLEDLKKGAQTGSPSSTGCLIPWAFLIAGSGIISLMVASAIH